MRLLHLLCAVIAVLALLLAVIPEEDNFSGAVPGEYSFRELKQKFGESRNLDHAETRKLYNSLLTEFKEYFKHHRNTQEVARQAIFCNALRWRARLYARSRDGTYPIPVLTDWFLQLRDSYVHGLRYLPKNFFQDVGNALTGDFSFRRSILVIRQIRECLFPSVDSTGCPSYQFLRHVRGKNDDDVLASCTEGNPWYGSA
ncbi:hypothetical protein TraAM80_01245 [Trypanosoma rangeli]|uniref:Uncharacterized protein n=1 Tax=Trypanosoma rangeli TaxID=5698 RepID=A0A422NZW7_TRYRA|nr:uncharacterized protein TraAM80_01245 [Trypanosoma rangeli]RNF10979.1 hypothetical protein TraAM80_01245 [Trypanosoma rangeli]|eukprot:RNF10979.1 hypothetical protein TraAM80_01245 [Trypanosoma rangeli]